MIADDCEQLTEHALTFPVEDALTAEYSYL